MRTKDLSEGLRKLISFMLVLTTIGSVVVFRKGETVEASGGLTKFQQAVQDICYEYGDWITTNGDLGLPYEGWCGYYVKTVLNKALSRCGYNNYSDYYPVTDITGANSISRYYSGDTRWKEYYSWCDWNNTNGNGKSAIKTDNRNSYTPQVGDVWCVAWDEDSNTKTYPDGINDPDHVVIVMKVNSDGSVLVSEGNTGSRTTKDGTKFVGQFTYKRTKVSFNGRKYDKEYTYRRGGGTVVCAVRPYDPTAGSSAPDMGGLYYPSDDFYAYIVKRDGWVHLEAAETSGAEHNVSLAKNGNYDNYECQLWRFEKQSNGTYVIYNQHDGSVLDAYNGGNTSGTNVISYSEYKGGANQQWYLYQNSSGIVIKSAHCNLVLDVNGGSSDAGTNVQLWDYNGSAAQVFSVYIIAKRYTTSTFNAYIINKTPWKHIEATDSGNVQIAANGNDSTDPKQIWTMYLQSDKSYMIANAYDGKVLDCNNGDNTKGTNVLTYSSNGASNQRFYLYSVESEYGSKAGGFIIRPKYSNHLVMDVNGGTANKGTNISLWNFNFTDAQVFSGYDLKNDGVNYSKPGKPSAPSLTAPSSATVGSSIDLSWTKSALTSNKFDARKYQIVFADSTGKELMTADTTDTSAKGISCNQAGTFKIWVRAVNTKYRDYYSTSNTVTLTVGDKVSPITSVDALPSYVYSGSAIRPSVTVRAGSKILTQGTDYTVEYSNNINVGTATVKVTGKGSYTGTKTVTFEISARSIASSTFGTIPSQTYTGSYLTPSVTVVDGGRTLVKDKDYTVEYSNNKNVGTATVTVTGKGNYNGSRTLRFGIEASSDITVDPITDHYAYTGFPVFPVITVRAGGRTLTEGTDYTVLYWDNTNVGTATVEILFKGNYSGKTYTTYEISPASVVWLHCDDIPAQMYTGSAISPKVRVMDGVIELKEGTDYIVEYSNNTNAGKATATVTGIGNYSGSRAYDFTIEPKSITGVTSEFETSHTYTGKPITPDLLITDGSVTLVRDKDYTLEYYDNTEVGTSTVKVTGKGNYKGTFTRTFTINPAPQLTVKSVSSQTYTGSEIKPALTVKYGSKTLKQDQDYTVEYSDNINAGTATAVVTGKGSYQGTKTVTFTINPKSMSGLSVTTVSSMTYTGSALKPSVKVTDGSRTLKKNTDYTVKYSDNTNPGTATVTITGKGNYSGKKSVTFEIIEEAKPVYSWVKISGKWYYIDEKGNKATGLADIDGSIYCFSAEGIMLTGWQKIDGVWYYFASSGEAKTGWQKISKKWYCFNDKGMMLTGLQMIDGKIYFFDANGIMKTGWQQAEGKWYYFLSGGDAAIGWKKISGKWYWFFEDGSMAANGVLLSGSKMYIFNSSGVCTNP